MDNDAAHFDDWEWERHDENSMNPKLLTKPFGPAFVLLNFPQYYDKYKTIILSQSFPIKWK